MIEQNQAIFGTAAKQSRIIGTRYFAVVMFAAILLGLSV
jgi:hypothetical protein|tara:strand:+ start:279 stop:395 length:117 start_codon:yes stop_codon:yes gene_type:complete